MNKRNTINCTYKDSNEIVKQIDDIFRYLKQIYFWVNISKRKK